MSPKTCQRRPQQDRRRSKRVWAALTTLPALLCRTSGAIARDVGAAGVTYNKIHVGPTFTVPGALSATWLSSTIYYQGLRSGVGACGHAGFVILRRRRVRRAVLRRYRKVNARPPGDEVQSGRLRLLRDRGGIL